MDTFSGALAASDLSQASHIVLSHDIHEQTAHVLVDFMLETLADYGYRAVTVGECLGDPSENWYRQGGKE